MVKIPYRSVKTRRKSLHSNDVFLQMSCKLNAKTSVFSQGWPVWGYKHGQSVRNRRKSLVSKKVYLQMSILSLRAKRGNLKPLNRDCFVTVLLAMTGEEGCLYSTWHRENGVSRKTKLHIACLCYRLFLQMRLPLATTRLTSGAMRCLMSSSVNREKRCFIW